MVVMKESQQYIKWLEDYTAARSKGMKLEVLKKTSEGAYGDNVKHSVFGLADFDGVNRLDKDDLRNMAFYAKLERV